MRALVTENADRRGAYISVLVVTDKDADPADVRSAIYEAANKALCRYPDAVPVGT